jgi:hypothetical protein
MHPYLRAYLAGIALPTMVVPVVIAVLSVQHPTGRPFHIEDVAIFPIGLVPNAWGLWNMLFVWMRKRWRIPAGLHGALLVLVLAPVAYTIQLTLGKMLWTRDLFVVGFPAALAGYYLAWKYIVSRFNDVLGVGA